MTKSAIILAGGSSSRFGQDKALIKLLGKPLILRVIDAVYPTVEEVLIVVSSHSQAENIKGTTDSEFPVLIDDRDLQGPLAGALTGFEHGKGTYSLLLPCDTPLISQEVIQFLFDLCEARNAAIPRWPNGYIEPLQSVYRTNPASKAAQNALDQGTTNMRSMIDRMKKVRYVSTVLLQRLNPELSTFFNVNTPPDLKKVESLL